MRAILMRPHFSKVYGEINKTTIKGFRLKHVKCPVVSWRAISGTTLTQFNPGDPLKFLVKDLNLHACCMWILAAVHFKYLTKALLSTT